MLPVYGGEGSILTDIPDWTLHLERLVQSSVVEGGSYGSSDFFASVFGWIRALVQLSVDQIQWILSPSDGIDGLSAWRAQNLGAASNSHTLYSYEKLVSEVGSLVLILIFAMLIAAVRVSSNFLFRILYRTHFRIIWTRQCKDKKLSSSGETVDDPPDWKTFWNRHAKAESKFLECAWYTLYYTVFFTFGCIVFFQEPYLKFPSVHMWYDWPLHPTTPHLRVYYLLELGFYVQALVALLLFDTRRSDFLQYCIHHSATIVLVGGSYWARNIRIGVIILILHDCSDIFLYWTKSIRYLVWKKPSILESLTTVSFVLFAVSFFVTRLVLYPVLGLYPALIETREAIGNLTFYGEGNFCLNVLFGLHVFWYSLIVRIIVRTLSTNSVDDIRSDDDDDENSIEEVVADCKPTNSSSHLDYSLTLSTGGKSSGFSGKFSVHQNDLLAAHVSDSDILTDRRDPSMYALNSSRCVSFDDLSMPVATLDTSSSSRRSEEDSIRAEEHLCQVQVQAYPPSTSDQSTSRRRSKSQLSH